MEELIEVFASKLDFLPKAVRYAIGIPTITFVCIFMKFAKMFMDMLKRLNLDERDKSDFDINWAAWKVVIKRLFYDIKYRKVCSLQ